MTPPSSPGSPLPLGATPCSRGVNFSIYIKQGAQQVNLLLYLPEDQTNPKFSIPLNPSVHQTGNLWHLFVENIPDNLLYAFDITTSDNKRFFPVLDPYAKAIDSSHLWGNSDKEPYHALGKVVYPSSFDWEGIPSPHLDPKELIIYEMHVRGFTRDPSSKADHPGTFLGIIEKIPYLKELGVNAIELMPIHEFDETDVQQLHPVTQQKMVNYFGYSPLNFFSIMNRYSSHSLPGQDPIDEFKLMVRELHRNGIEIILDVVYNHTGEGNEKGGNISFKCLDREVYYMLDAEGQFLNFSGCGNTFNCNHSIVREFILDNLRYWVNEMHIDGFRFDLASILTRDTNGNVLINPPLVEAIAYDPILANTKLIAEAWDAGGLYQVGGFYAGSHWMEWNGWYRDIVRRFIKGNSGYKTAFATALSGSQNLYGWKHSPCCSINFVTSHDGFSLADLTSYNEKHNFENGENNRDGFDHNDSWNCGLEGSTDDPKILSLRNQQMRNLILALMLSQGIPMILMGDEYGHSRRGNNNTWCQDNELNWFQWNQIDQNNPFFRFYRGVIHFRKTHPLLGRDSFLTDKDITWHGTSLGNPRWESEDHFVAFALNDESDCPEIYTAFNASRSIQIIHLPELPNSSAWEWIVNTYNEPPDDFFSEGNRPRLQSRTMKLPPYSAILLSRTQI